MEASLANQWRKALCRVVCAGVLAARCVVCQVRAVQVMRSSCVVVPRAAAGVVMPVCGTAIAPPSASPEDPVTLHDTARGRIRSLTVQTFRCGASLISGNDRHDDTDFADGF